MKYGKRRISTAVLVVVFSMMLGIALITVALTTGFPSIEFEQPEKKDKKRGRK